MTKKQFAEKVAGVVIGCVLAEVVVKPIREKIKKVKEQKKGA